MKYKKAGTIKGSHNAAKHIWQEFDHTGPRFPTGRFLTGKCLRTGCGLCYSAVFIVSFVRLNTFSFEPINKPNGKPSQQAGTDHPPEHFHGTFLSMAFDFPFYFAVFVLCYFFVSVQAVKFLTVNPVLLRKLSPRSDEIILKTL